MTAGEREREEVARCCSGEGFVELIGRRLARSAGRAWERLGGFTEGGRGGQA